MTYLLDEWCLNNSHYMGRVKPGRLNETRPQLDRCQLDRCLRTFFESSTFSAVAGNAFRNFLNYASKHTWPRLELSFLTGFAVVWLAIMFYFLYVFRRLHKKQETYSRIQLSLIIWDMAAMVLTVVSRFAMAFHRSGVSYICISRWFKYVHDWPFPLLNVHTVGSLICVLSCCLDRIQSLKRPVQYKNTDKAGRSVKINIVSLIVGVLFALATYNYRRVDEWKLWSAVDSNSMSVWNNDSMSVWNNSMSGPVWNNNSMSGPGPVRSTGMSDVKNDDFLNVTVCYLRFQFERDCAAGHLSFIQGYWTNKGWGFHRHQTRLCSYITWDTQWQRTLFQGVLCAYFLLLAFATYLIFIFRKLRMLKNVNAAALASNNNNKNGNNGRNPINVAGAQASNTTSGSGGRVASSSSAGRSLLQSRNLRSDNNNRIENNKNRKVAAAESIALKVRLPRMSRRQRRELGERAHDRAVIIVVVFESMLTTARGILMFLGSRNWLFSWGIWSQYALYFLDYGTCGLIILILSKRFRREFLRPFLRCFSRGVGAINNNNNNDSNDAEIRLLIQTVFLIYFVGSVFMLVIVLIFVDPVTLFKFFMTTGN